MINKKLVGLFLSIMIIIIISQTLVVTAQHPGSDDSSSEVTETITFSDYSSVGTSWENTLESEFSDKSIKNIIFELTWTDDEGTDSDPDTFSLQTDDEMNDPKSDSGSSGSVSTTWNEERLNNVWNIVVTCDSAGPTTVPRGPLGILTTNEPDPGNSWTLVVTYTYTKSSGGMGGMPPNVAAVYSSPIFWIHVGLMISSTYLFLFTGVFAGLYLYSRNKWNRSESNLKRYFTKPNLIIICVFLAFIAFFLASVPIGMWVAGMMYGWAKAWTGFPALWNPEAFEFTNADNVSLIVLVLWAIPLYLNRRQVMQTKWFKKLFGWNYYLMKKAETAPEPKLHLRELALCYFFMGLFVYLVFMVQPHGGGS
jgi:hypothetical protein